MRNKFKPRTACANVSENISSRDTQHKAGKCRANQFTLTLRQTTLQYSAHFVHNRYLFTPWCRILLEKLTDLQLVKKFPAFHRTQRFITAHSSVRHLSLSWASPIQSIYPHPTFWRSILILSTHLRLGLPIGLLPSGFPTKTLYTLLSYTTDTNCINYLEANCCTGSL